jgi:hypothetical protein
VNRVSVRLVNGPVPTGQRDIGTNYSPLSRIDTLVTREQRMVALVMIIVSGCVCASSISCVIFVLVVAKP